MLVKVLGAIDILSGILFLLAIGVKPNTNILLFFGIILITKSSFGMLKDFASWIDFLSALLFILLIFTTIPKFILIIFSILLLQKGIFSLINF